MYLSCFTEGAPNKTKTPLDDRRCRSWPRTKAENDQLFMFIILGILISFSFYNICIYLNDRRQKRRQERRRQQREAEMDEEAEREDLEQRRNRVIAWIEVTETGQQSILYLDLISDQVQVVSKPASPIDIQRPKYQSLVPTGAQPDNGARPQRPKARRSKSAPLLGKGSTDSDLCFLYNTFDNSCQSPRPKKKSKAHANDKYPTETVMASGEATIKPTVSQSADTPVDLDDVDSPKKHVSFAANDNVIGSSWSTVLTGSAREKQHSTSK